MEYLSIFLTCGGIIATILIVLVGMHLAGRVEDRLQIALTAGMIVGGSIWLIRSEIDANENARTVVENLFRIDPDVEMLDFHRKAEKGTRSQTVEAIYQFSPEGFDAYKGKALGPIRAVSFNYRTGNWTDQKIDTFALSDGALAWTALPRIYRDNNSFFLNRGHYSHQHTPDEKDITGAFICAFIPVDSQTASGYGVIPCSVVGERNPDGIAILGILNERDRTLHTLIEASKVPASGF